MNVHNVLMFNVIYFVTFIYVFKVFIFCTCVLCVCFFTLVLRFKSPNLLTTDFKDCPQCFDTHTVELVARDRLV